MNVDNIRPAEYREPQMSRAARRRYEEEQRARNRLASEEIQLIQALRRSDRYNNTTREEDDLERVIRESLEEARLNSMAVQGDGLHEEAAALAANEPDVDENFDNCCIICFARQRKALFIPCCIAGHVP
jgi:hypothetical protein